MSVAVITGSAGLIGSEATRHFAAKQMDVVGIDNDMRSVFFGNEASTSWMSHNLQATLPNYTHYSADIRSRDEVFKIFRKHGKDIKLVIHTAAQPSHDWAAREPFTDFGVNAMGTLIMLEATRCYCPDAVFIFTSTNKVYGDTPTDSLSRSWRRAGRLIRIIPTEVESTKIWRSTTACTASLELPSALQTSWSRNTDDISVCVRRASGAVA